MKMYIVETTRTVWENGNITDKIDFGKSYFTDFAEAKHRAEVNHKTGMDLLISSKDANGKGNEVSTDVWLWEYVLIGNEFFHNKLRGHYDSRDAETAPVGLVFSHCE